MRSFIADCRHAIRLYVRTPAASLIAVTGFALAMAAVTAFVSLYVDLVLRPHPGFERGNPIVTFGWSNGQNASGGLPAELIDLIAEEVASLDAAAGAAPSNFLIGSDGESVRAELVTSEFFPGVRARLAMGRGFEAEEHFADGAPVIVISDAFWQSHFDGREDILGTSIQIGAPGSVQPGAAEAPAPKEYRVVGVMDKRFTGTQPPESGERAFWMPMEQGMPMVQGGADGPMAELRLMMLANSTRGIGRRAAGASAGAIANELDSRYEDELGGGAVLMNLQGTPRFDVLDGLVFDPNVQRSTKRQLQLFLVVSLLLALVAAANIGLFQLARAPGRRRELGIRMSVGAPLNRIVRQLANESVVLVFTAATLGVLLSVWLARFLRGLTLMRDAQWRDVTLLDWRVLAIIAVVVIVMTAVVSLAPIIGLKRLGIAGSSRQIAARATVAQRIAGACQIALAGSIGAAAIAFAWYLSLLMFGFPGYNTRDLQVADLRLPSSPDTRIDKARLRDAILSIPGIDEVSISDAAPGAPPYSVALRVAHPQDPERQMSTLVVSIDPYFVDVLGLRMLHGRAPVESDVGVVLVNEVVAREVWGRTDVVGEVLPWNISREQQFSVIGVLEDVSFGHPAAEAAMTLYTVSSFGQAQSLALIETAMTSADLQQALQGLIDSGAIEGQITDVQSIDALRRATLVDDRVRSYLTISAAALVVMLAAFGFYGTQRYLVAAGRREYAIRASLGAGPRKLGHLVFQRGFWLGLPGLVLSLPLAFIVVAWLRGDHVGEAVSPAIVAAGVVVGLCALVLVASFGPARQARNTQPAPLLRED